MGDVSNAINPIFNQVGAAAVPALGAMFGIPPQLTSAVRSGISGINGGQGFSGQQQGMQGLDFPFPGMGTGGVNILDILGGLGGGQFGGGQYGTPPFGRQQQQSNGLGGLGQLLPFLTQGMGLLSSLGQFQQGGHVNMNKARFKEGGFVGFAQNPVPIQTEQVKRRGKTIPEQIIWPDFTITDVNATESHKDMMKSGDGDKVTDMVDQNVFITSSYGGIKIKKKDADKIETDLKLHPYSEHEKGKEPEVITLGDVLFGKKSKKQYITPAEASDKLRRKFKTVRGYEGLEKFENDVFTDITNEVNKITRGKYLQGVIQLSEFEKNKKELARVKRENKKAINSVVKAADGGVFKAQQGGPIPPDVWDKITEISNPDPRGPLHSNNPITPLTTPNNPLDLLSVFSGGPDIYNGAQAGNTSSFNTPFGGGQGAPQGGGNSFLTSLGTVLSGAGTTASVIDNFVTAGNLSSLLGGQRSALQNFRDNQQNLFGASRMAAIAPSLLGPEAAQREERAQRSFVSPTAAFGLESAGLDNQFGQMLSTLRNNPNISSGETISSIINAQAPSRVGVATNRLNREQQILTARDTVGDANQDIRFQNQSDRNALTNSRLQNTFQNVSGLFTDIAGNEAGRIRDDNNIALAQLLQPQQLRQAGLQGVTNLGGLFLGSEALRARNTQAAQPQGGGFNIGSLVSNPDVLNSILGLLG